MREGGGTAAYSSSCITRAAVYRILVDKIPLPGNSTPLSLIPADKDSALPGTRLSIRSEIDVNLDSCQWMLDSRGTYARTAAMPSCTSCGRPAESKDFYCRV